LRPEKTLFKELIFSATASHFVGPGSFPTFTNIPDKYFRSSTITCFKKKMAVFWDVAPCNLTNVSELLKASIIIALMMETVSNS
jgi:hypothetical protein